MTRRLAAGLAAIMVLETLQTAACPLAQAAGPFPEEVIERPPARSNAWAYAAMAGGVGLIGASFTLAERANDRYADYLAATDPDRIDSLYDETTRYDRFASGALISGELLVSLGLYMRFLRRPSPMHVSFGPTRCAVAWRF